MSIMGIAKSYRMHGAIMSTIKVQPHHYSDNIINAHALMIGPYPPPLGGVSVHIKRVMHKLKKQNNTVHCFDNSAHYNKYTKFLYPVLLLYTLARQRPHVVFYHTIFFRLSLWELTALKFLKYIFRYQIILIEHDCRHMYNRSPAWISKFIALIQQCSRVILIGNRTYESYKSQQIPLNNCTIEEAFLPPALHEEASILATYPPEIFSFLANHTPIISANAFQLVMLNGKDLYGLDISIQLLKQLRTVYPSAGLIIGLANIGNTAYYNMLQHQIMLYGLQDEIFFLHNQKELWPIIKRSDLFIRPTQSDGASISISEALHFKVPVIASDVCTRPPGTLLFSIENLSLLIRIAQKALLRKDAGETIPDDQQRYRLHPQPPR